MQRGGVGSLERVLFHVVVNNGSHKRGLITDA